jgi:hypothetical protein
VTDIRAKRLAYQLKDNPIVVRAEVNLVGIDVKFITGVTERWRFGDRHYQKIRDRKFYTFAFIEGESEPVPIRAEFETEPDDLHISEKSRHLVLAYEDFTKASFLQQRLALHRFVHELTRGGWQRIWYPDAALWEDFERVRALERQPWRHWCGGTLFTTPAMGYWHHGRRRRASATPGRKLIEHFIDLSHIPGRLSTYAESWRARKIFWLVTRFLAEKRDVTRSAIVRAMRWYQIGAGPRICAPGAYFCMVRQGGIIPRAVVDVHAGLGSKIVAAAAIGADAYLTVEPLDGQRAALARFLGLETGTYAGQLCDVAFVDQDLHPYEGSVAHLRARHLFIVRGAGGYPLGQPDDEFNVMTDPHTARARGGAPEVMLHYRRG